LNKANPPRGPIAYLTGEYPAVSHTFILREVEALRKHGADVITCSIRETNPDQHLGKAEKDAFSTTFYVLTHAKKPIRLLRDHASMIFKSPRRYFKAMNLAIKTRSPGLKSLVYQFFYFAEAVVLSQYLQSKNVRHLHNHFGDSSCTVAMLANTLTEIPFSFTMHGPTEFFEIDRWYLGEKVARAAFVSCISHFCRSQVMAFSDPAHWPRLRIVHCGIDPSLYGKTSKKHGKELLFVGRLAAVKGVPILIEAYAEILKKHPDARLTLIGDGPERYKVEALIDKFELQNKICLTGYLNQKEVAKRLSESDVFILPSFAEGVPVVLMEAMASGIPVVTTQIAGISELVEDGKSGFVTRPGDAEMLSLRILELLRKPKMCEQMGKVGRETVIHEYDSMKEAHWLLELIENRTVSGLRPNR
jgi:glycosyltransferase involved in cell wall biosynthesis